MNEADLIGRAKLGASGAFDELVNPHLPSLRALVHRLVMHTQDTEDLVQETLLAAHQRLDTFRGHARFRTWLLSIGAHKSIDHLRSRKRWPVDAQAKASGEHLESPELLDRIEQAASPQGFGYEYREHITYCFSCVGRSLDPEEAAALLLREVFQFTNAEAAKALGLSLSTFRHRFAHARTFMIEAFEETCALIGKQGVCWQCDGLRDHLPEAKRGAPVEKIEQAASAEQRFRRRLTIVREAKFGTGGGKTKPLHDYIVGYMAGRFG